jgi:hypothetical protein
LTDPVRQGPGLFGPIIVDEAKAPDVDHDAAAVLSNWNVESGGQIGDGFVNPAIG